VEPADVVARDDGAARGRGRRQRRRARARVRAAAPGRVAGHERALHLQRDALEVDDDLARGVAQAVLLERGEQRGLVEVVEGLPLFVVDVDDVDVSARVRVAGDLVEADVVDLDPVDELALVRRDLPTAAHLVHLAVDRTEGEALYGLVQAEPDHVELEQLRAAVGHERARHDLVVLEVAREVPVISLEELLADKQPQPVRAAARHDVGHAVDHEHLARAELVRDAR